MNNTRGEEGQGIPVFCVSLQPQVVLEFLQSLHYDVPTVNTNTWCRVIDSLHIATCSIYK